MQEKVKGRVQQCKLLYTKCSSNLRSVDSVAVHGGYSGLMLAGGGAKALLCLKFAILRDFMLVNTIFVLTGLGHSLYYMYVTSCVSK